MQNKHPAADVRLITKTELCRRLAASEASIDRWLRSDPSFPQARRLASGRSGGSERTSCASSWN